MLERIFDMFEQVDRAHAKVSGGLGIGLTLVRQLVEAQGGNVHATSAGLGLGSEFLVRMPLAVPMADIEEKPFDDVAVVPPASAQRVLIADDNEDAAGTLAQFLEMAGHETRIASDGAQALAIAEEFRPHVAILDIAMPVLDGLQTARALRERSLGHRVRLFALSGFGQDVDRQQSTAAGFDEHFVKPVDLRLLQEAIGAGSSLG